MLGYDYEKCKEIATKAHGDQKRKDKITPYIVHPIAVAESFPEDALKLRCISALHDVLEDTPVTAQDLIRAGVPIDVVEIVEILSRKKGQNYLDYLRKIKQHPDAVRVKLADLEHNLSDLEFGTMRDKYLLAREFLVWGD